MTRQLGVVSVRIGRELVPVSVEAESGAATRVDISKDAFRIIVAADLEPDDASREVENVLPEVQRQLVRKLMN